jgi:hypothetical protein
MGAFGNILFIVIGINIILALFGVISGTGNAFATLLEPNVDVKYFLNMIIDNLNPVKTPANLVTALAAIGALSAGLVTKRDDLIYFPVVLFFVSGLGVFNFLTYIFTGNLQIIGIILKVGFMIIFSWSAVEWLRGVER